APVQYSARGKHGILGSSSERKCSLQTKGNHNDQAHHLDTRRRHRAQLRFRQLCCPEAESESEGPGADLLHPRDRGKLIPPETHQLNNKPPSHSRRTTMTKLIVSALATVIALSSVSTSFAAPKQTSFQQCMAQLQASGRIFGGNSEDAGMTQYEGMA